MAGNPKSSCKVEREIHYIATDIYKKTCNLMLNSMIYGVLVRDDKVLIILLQRDIEKIFYLMIYDYIYYFTIIS